MLYLCKSPNNDLGDLEKYLKTGKYAAVIMEPVSLVSPEPGYLQGVRGLCDTYDTILIFDELITGFRWALGGAQEYYGVTADIATYGKAIANGMPISVLTGKKKYMNELNDVFFSGTYLGDTLSIAAAISTIKELRDKRFDIYSHIWAQGERLQSSFNDYCRKISLDAEMFGLAPRHNIKFNVNDPTGAKDLFHQEMISNGVFVGTQVYVTWAHKHDHIDKTIDAIMRSLDVVKYAVENDKIDELVLGDRSSAIFKQQLGRST